jgi:hypothetical protein
MNVKNTLKSLIRGWFPQEPILPARVALSQTKPRKARIIQNAIIGFLVIVGISCSLLLVSYSWIKILLLASILIGGIVWFVSRGKFKRPLKYFVLALMIFGIVFGSFESYVFWNAGYPSTLMPSESAVTISYPRILNVTLTEVIKSAENTVAFKVFRLEHPGEVTFESILLDTTFPGGEIEVNMGLGFISSAGYHYHASNLPWIGQPPSHIYPQQQSPEETLKQIDNIGLQSFYKSASETYQNRTGTQLNITSLEISTQWSNYSHYQGITLSMTGWQRIGNSLYDIFNAAFQPDGTLLNMNIPT